MVVYPAPRKEPKHGIKYFSKGERERIHVTVKKTMVALQARGAMRWPWRRPNPAVDRGTG